MSHRTNLPFLAHGAHSSGKTKEGEIENRQQLNTAGFRNLR